MITIAKQRKALMLLKKKKINEKKAAYVYMHLFFLVL